jgi:hypothetical protein
MPIIKNNVPEKVRPKPMFKEGLPAPVLRLSLNVRTPKKARTPVYTATPNVAATARHFIDDPYLIAEEYFSWFWKLSEMLGAK